MRRTLSSAFALLFSISRCSDLTRVRSPFFGARKQGFTGVQLDPNFSWHRFQVGLPTFFVRLRPAKDPAIAHDAPAVWKQGFGARLVSFMHHLLSR
jgi:hypothetical protein